MTDCLSDSDLHRYHAGEPDSEEESRIRQHLAECEGCARRDAELVAEHEGLIEQARGLEPTETQKATGEGPGDEPASPPPDSFPGYSIIREIHRGGQGVVYQAVQKSTKRKVAIKVMKEGPFSSRADQARFDREIQVLGQLNHPSIVAIHDTGVVSGTHYFVMDYISGQPLDVYMASGERTIRDTLRLFQKICDAVNAAHLKGVIHRDLKPGNIRIDAEGNPHILDFGLAKTATTEAEASLMTMTGQFMGSLPWASPEQAEAMPGKIDVRTDVYSLGVILYHMLTSRFPYEVVGNLRDVLDRIMRAEPARPSTVRRQIDDEVETIVLKCLSKERERRYQTAGELGRDVGHYLAGEPIEAKRDSGWYVLKKSLRRYRVPVALATAFLVLIVSSVVALSVMYANAEEAREAESKQRLVAEEQRKVAEENMQLAEQRYEEIIRLADLKRLADAEAVADELWPAHPEQIEAMETWLAARAAPLRDNLPKHEATLRGLRAQARDYDAQQQRHDRETHPRAAELAEQERQLPELRKQLEEARAEREAVDKPENDLDAAETKESTNAEDSASAAARAAKIEELEKSIAETEQSISELQEAVNERRTWKFSDDQTQWQHDTLAGLVTDLEAFVDPDPKKGTLASVKERLEFAENIERRSVSGPQAAAKWAEAIAEIGRLEVYAGLQIKPQVGLLPLRRDPRSGLWEFWHIQTGTQPEPNPDDQAVNTWTLTGDTGLVFVLIPGGTFWMGAQKDDPEGHNYDSQAESDEGPVHEVTLAAFFMSKYEMTQGQWERFTGANPSNYGPSWNWRGEPPADEPIHQNQPWNPVEQVSWIECQDIVARLGLVLPTEAQWEYAARAGTNTVWWTGNEKESIDLKRAGNLADGWSKNKGAPATWFYEDWLEDGWVVHAPVGSLSPNAFGLHDVIGNVLEWCRDGYAGYDRDVEPGDGLRKFADARNRVARGGSFGNTAATSRSAHRNYIEREVGIFLLGVRPARVITE